MQINKAIADVIKSGAFAIDSNGVIGYSAGNENQPRYTVTFNANTGASTKGIYGNSTTVQPKSRVVYIYRRES